MKKLRKGGLLILSTILLLLVVGFFALTSTPPFNKSAGTPIHINLKNLTVWHIGSSNVILDEVLERMQLLGVLQVMHLGMQEFFLNDTPISMDVNELSLVIFDGDQISERVGNPEIHDSSERPHIKEQSWQRSAD